MKRFRFSLPVVPLLLVAALLILGIFVFGCENQVEAPEAMTLQTRSAVEVLPADAQVVGMINLQEMHRNTAFDPFDAAHIGGEFSARVHDFIEATGFDPANDLREVYFAATNLEPQPNPSFVAYATFDQERLQAYVEQNMNDAFERTDYKGITIYRAQEGNDHVAFAIANDNMMVGATEVATVEAMLDRLTGSGNALKDNAETMKLITQASGESSAWFVARDIGARFESHAQASKTYERDIVQIGQALKNVAVAVRMQQDKAVGTVFMQPQQGVSSSDIADLTKGVVAAMKASPELDDNALQMLDQVRVLTSGDQVRVNFTVDNATLQATRRG